MFTHPQGDYVLPSRSKFRIAILSACLSAAVLLSACGNKEKPNPAAMMAMMTVPVRVVPAVSTNVPLTTSAVGNVEAMASVDVKSRVAGQILHVYIGDGKDVKQGELLFDIDPEPLQRQLAELQ